MSAATRRFLTVYYGYVFLFDFVLCYAIYTAYFELNGLSYAQIGVLLAFWSGSALVLEIFTGALSDWLDRRWLLIAAPAIKIATFVCWALADGNLWLYGLGFACWSLAGALVSGTGEALLHERLQSEGEERAFGRVYGRAVAAQSVGIGAGFLGGGFVAATDMTLTVWLSIPPLVVASLLAFLLTDIRRTAEREDEPGYFQTIRLALGEFRGAPNLRFVTLYIALGLTIFGELEEFDQLYYTAVSLPTWLFGVAGAIGLGVRALLGMHAHRLSRMKSLAWTLPILGGALLVVAALGANVYCVVVLEAAYLVAIPTEILSKAHFQHLLESQARATSTSVLELSQNASGLVLAVAFGALASAVGILPAYGWAGISIIPTFLLIWWRQPAGSRVF